jgi:hypothetical protein
LPFVTIQIKLQPVHTSINIASLANPMTSHASAFESQVVSIVAAVSALSTDSRKEELVAVGEGQKDKVASAGGYMLSNRKALSKHGSQRIHGEVMLLALQVLSVLLLRQASPPQLYWAGSPSEAATWYMVPFNPQSLGLPPGNPVEMQRRGLLAHEVKSSQDRYRQAKRQLKGAQQSLAVELEKLGKLVDELESVLGGPGEVAAQASVYWRDSDDDDDDNDNNSSPRSDAPTRTGSSVTRQSTAQSSVRGSGDQSSVPGSGAPSDFSVASTDGTGNQ